MVQVSIVIPGYNASPHFEDCLGSISSQDFPDSEVIWVDSASTDDSLQRIRTQFPQAKIVTLTSNVGYRRAVNIGAHKAQGEYLVVCNQDTRMDTAWLSEMVESIEADRTVGIIAPKILMFDDSQVINEAGNTLHYTGLYGSRGIGAQIAKYSVPETIATMSGCCFLIRRDLWTKLGGFSEDFDQFDTDWHASFEDVDLAWRAQLMGYKVMFCPRALMYHKYEAKGMPPERFCSYEWGRYLVILRNYELRTLILLIPPLLVIEAGAWLYAIAKGQPWLTGKAGVMNWLATNIPQLRQMRCHVQESRTVPDRTIVKRMDYKIQITHLVSQSHIARSVQGVSDLVFEAYYRLLLLGLSLFDRG